MVKCFVLIAIEENQTDRIYKGAQESLKVHKYTKGAHFFVRGAQKVCIKGQCAIKEQ